MTQISTQQLIQSIYLKLKDYRAYEKGAPKMSERRINRWIKQFDKKSRKPILFEVNSIFKKRYFSRKRVKKILHKFIIESSKDFRFKSVTGFLNHCQFLDVQQEGRSQGDMLALMDEVLQSKFRVKISDCGSKSHQYTIYLDDMLCTGNTLLNDVRRWTARKFFRKKTNLEAVRDGATKMILFYIFFHQRGYDKKLKQFRYEFPGVAKNIHIYKEIEINNYGYAAFNQDLIHPVKSSDKRILKYHKTIEEQVNDYVEANRFSNSIQRYFRNDRRPLKDKFFTSPERRRLIELEFLIKGIEILRSANTKKKNVRALGFSLPSERNFGFGALCFTWRNISNNAPLVFWYSAGSFIPLFRRIDR
jgi:hypothetical protein